MGAMGPRAVKMVSMRMAAMKAGVVTGSSKRKGPMTDSVRACGASGWRGLLGAAGLLVASAAGAGPLAPAGLLAQADANAPVSKSLIQYIRDGGEIGYVIIFISFIAVTLIVMQAVRIRLGKLAPPEHVERLDELLASGKVEPAIEFCRENESTLTRIMGTALTRCQRSTFGMLELNAALEDAGQHEMQKLGRETDWLALIAGVAPMLGLLGTVVGMVGAFDVLGIADGPVKPGELAGNISVALITTVLGLIVAIPCTAAFTYFRNRVDQYADDIAMICEQLAATLESSKRGVQRPARAAASARAGAAAGGPVVGGAAADQRG